MAGVVCTLCFLFIVPAWKCFPQNSRRLEFEHYPAEELQFYLLDVLTSANLIDQISRSLVCVYFRWRFFVVVFPPEVETDQLLGLVFPSGPHITTSHLCVSLLIYDRKVQSFSSSVGSNPPSRCCLLAESIHHTCGIKLSVFVQICAIYLNFISIYIHIYSADSDLWPLMYNLTH